MRLDGGLLAQKALGDSAFGEFGRALILIALNAAYIEQLLTLLKGVAAVEAGYNGRVEGAERAPIRR